MHLYLYIQFNLKTLFKDGDPVSLQLIFPGAIQTCEQYTNCSYIYTKQHRFIVQTQANTTYTFIQKHIHKHSYLTHTAVCHSCKCTLENCGLQGEISIFLKTQELTLY